MLCIISGKKNVTKPVTANKRLNQIPNWNPCIASSIVTIQKVMPIIMKQIVSKVVSIAYPFQKKVTAVKQPPWFRQAILIALSEQA